MKSKAYAQELLDTMYRNPGDVRETLEASELLRLEILDHQVLLVRAMRNAGYSWFKIGNIFGITPQGAHNRWAHEDEGMK